MTATEHKPELIIIAGPNGSGKTSVTQKFLHHEWAEGTTYINPDQIAKDTSLALQHSTPSYSMAMDSKLLNNS